MWPAPRAVALDASAKCWPAQVTIGGSVAAMLTEPPRILLFAGRREDELSQQRHGLVARVLHHATGAASKLAVANEVRWQRSGDVAPALDRQHRIERAAEHQRRAEHPRQGRQQAEAASLAARAVEPDGDSGVDPDARSQVRVWRRAPVQRQREIEPDLERADLDGENGVVAWVDTASLPPHTTVPVVVYAGSAGVAARGEAQPFIKNESRSTVGWLDVQRFWLSRHENLLGHSSRRTS